MNRLASASSVLAILGAVAFPGVAAADCTRARSPGANEIIVFGNAECTGPEQVYKLGRHARLDGWSDEISSMKVGSNVKVTIYIDRDLLPKADSATLWRGNYPHMQWFGDAISSLDIAVAGDGPTITMFEHPQAESGKPNQTIHTIGLGNYNQGEKKHELLLADLMSYIRIPSGVKVTLYDGHNFEGQNEAFDGGARGLDLDLLKEGWDDRVSSLKVERLGYEMYKVDTWKEAETNAGSDKEMIGGSNVCKNDVNATSPITCTLEISYSETKSSSFSWNQNTSLTVGVSLASSASVEVPGVGTAGSELTVSTELAQSFGTDSTKGEETSKAINASQEVTVLPGEEIQASVMGRKNTKTFYPRYHYRPEGSKSDANAYTRNGTITVDMFAEVETDTKVIKNAVTRNSAAIPSITRGSALEVNKKYFTKAKNYYVVLQDDGNLVVYDKGDAFVWGSHNDAQAPLNGTSAELQMSGNFVLLDARDNIIWQTGVENPQAVLAIENRQLKVLDQSNQTLWPK